MNYIRRILNEYCISHRAFSQMTRLDRSGLVRLFAGKHKPRLDTIKILSEGLSEIDGRDWKEHAANIKREVYGKPILKIVGEE